MASSPGPSRSIQAGDALVQVGAVGFRQGRVGGVAEQDVVEAVAVVAGLGGCAAGGRSRRRESASSSCATWLVRERGDDAARELASGDGGALEHAPLGVGEPAEPAGEDGLERRRQPLAALGREGGELLGVERVALGELDDPLARLLVEVGGAGDELARLVGRRAGRASGSPAGRSSSGPRARQRTRSGASARSAR